MSYSSQIDLSQLTKRDYALCFLKRNPFPSTAIPEDLPQITVDREDVIRHFKDVISALYIDGSSTITVLSGGYGSGKSHLLKVFKNNIQSQLLDSEKATLAVYINSPGRNFLDLFFALIDDVGRDYLARVSNTLINKFLIQNERAARKEFIRGTITDSTDLSKIKIDDLFQMIVTFAFLKEFNRFFMSDVKNSDLLTALFFLSHPTYSDPAYRWFLGEKISAEERKFMRISGMIDHHRIAYNMMEPLLTSFKLSGVENIVLLIDELEKILLITSTLRSQYQDDLRHLIDENPKNLAIFFSITPGEWDRLSDQPTALTRRLSGNTFPLEDFDIERIKDLIKGYLHYSRISDFSKDIIDSLDFTDEYELYPFTSKSVDFIMDMTKGRISSVLMVCRRAIDYYIDYNKDFTFIDDSLMEILAKTVNF